MCLFVIYVIYIYNRLAVFLWPDSLAASGENRTDAETIAAERELTVSTLSCPTDEQGCRKEADGASASCVSLS